MAFLDEMRAPHPAKRKSLPMTLQPDCLEVSEGADMIEETKIWDAAKTVTGKHTGSILQCSDQEVCMSHMSH